MGIIQVRVCDLCGTQHPMAGTQNSIRPCEISLGFRSDENHPYPAEFDACATCRDAIWRAIDGCKFPSGEQPR